MSELRERLKQEFVEQEYREAYAEDFLNTSIATQMQAIREQRNMTQGELAEKVGTKQAGISRIENVNYSAWKIETLKKIAFALGCRLKVSLETFGSLLDEAEVFSRESLERVPFEQDPAFSVQSTTTQTEVTLSNLELLSGVSDIQMFQEILPIGRGSKKKYLLGGPWESTLVQGKGNSTEATEAKINITGLGQ